ncbi:MAG: hypothetical protein KGI98_15570 [Euryarchaeota archaeon]|nr:hypothetical protein [Euryarchaeota archaeon]
MPTRAMVFERLALAQQYWGQLHKEQMTDWFHFSLQQQVSVPDGFNVIRPATGYTICAAAADHIAGDGPQVLRPPKSRRQKDEESSERVQRALEAAQHRFAAEVQTNPVRSLVMSLMWGGMAVSQGPIYDPDAWGDEPVRGDFMAQGQDADTAYAQAKEDYEFVKQRRWPFYWRAVDPRWVFPDPGTIGKKWVILYYRRSVGEIKAQWPAWNGKLPASSDAGALGSPAFSSLSGQLGGGTAPGSGSVGARGYYLDTDLVEWVEYWDSTHRIYIAANEVVDARAHKYGKPPFQIRSAGYGNDMGLPHEKFRSLIYPVRSLLEQEIRALCQFDAIMRQNAWPQIMTPIGSALKTLQPGTVVPMRPEDIAATKVLESLDPKIVEALANEIGIIQKGIEDGTYPGVVRGERAKGIPSGYGQQSLVAQARMRFGPPAAAMESLLAEFYSDFLACVENVVGEKVPIWGPTAKGFLDEELDPDDIAGYYYTIVSLNPKMPMDRANEVAIGQGLLQLGAIDMDTFLKDFAGYPNPEQMRVQRMRDEILNQPTLKRIMELAAIDELGLLDWLMDQSKKVGVDPMQVMQAFGIMNEVGGRPQNGQTPPNGSAQPPPEEMQGPVGGSLSGSNATIFPTQQAQPMPGSPADVRGKVAQPVGSIVGLS